MVGWYWLIATYVAGMLSGWVLLALCIRYWEHI
jgi:hypothetical protein